MANVPGSRPSWDEYFLEIALKAQSRTNCLRMSVGVVIVKDRHIIATGYNGTPAGAKNCIDGGCERCLDRENNVIREKERKDLCICVHAELNAILQSAYHGVSTEGAVLYATVAPCIQCAMAIINAGIKTVVYINEYDNDLGLKLLTTAGVEARRFVKSQA